MKKFIKALLITALILFAMAIFSVVYAILTHYFWWIQFVFLAIGILCVFYIVCEELNFKEE